MGVGVKEIGQCVHCNPIPSDRLKEKPGKYCLKDCPRKYCSNATCCPTFNNVKRSSFPGDCEYGQWGEWQGDNHCLYCIRSDPSNKDPKEMTRIRAVKKEAIGGGEPCDKKIETVSCESIKTKEKCKDVKVEHWSDWSSCIIPPEKGAGKGPLKTNCHSVKGKQTRTRRCKKQGCKEKLEESKDCLTICKSTGGKNTASIILIQVLNQFYKLIEILKKSPLKSGASGRNVKDWKRRRMVKSVAQVRKQENESAKNGSKRIQRHWKNSV